MLIISKEDLPLKKTVKKFLLPTISYPSKNLMVKEEDDDVVCYLLKTLKTIPSSVISHHENNEDIKLMVKSIKEDSQMKSQATMHSRK